MKAMRIHQYGGPEVLRIESVPQPRPGPDQVLVRVQGAGVNPQDWKIRAGYLQQMVPLELPITLGGDFSGTVEAVGADVLDFKRGDEVYGQAAVGNGGSGSFAAYAITRSHSIALKPSSVSHAEAGGMPLVGVGALQVLTDYLRVSAGQKILIHDGAGGIGSMAIQLAKHLGAHVATTVSASDAEFAKALGAEEIVDYKKQKFEEHLNDLDAVFDTMGGDAYVRSFKVLKRGGRIVSLPEQPHLGLAKEFGVAAYMPFTQVTTKWLAELAKLVDQGAVEIVVGRTYPFEYAAWALLQLETHASKGKVVLKVM
jgi:NADPH:quinone reductase-like Zn-dependent oxidoreductase